jgi:hypothetical protein
MAVTAGLVNESALVAEVPGTGLFATADGTGIEVLGRKKLKRRSNGP